MLGMLLYQMTVKLWYMSLGWKWAVCMLHTTAVNRTPGKLECVGLVVPGSRLRLLKKTGETKTGYSTELVFVDEPESGAARPALVAHNPLLANRLIKKALHDGIISELSHLKQYEIKAEAKITDSFRVDFAYRDPGDGMAIKALVEVKSVCLADYNPETCPDRSGAVFVNPVTPYQRHALFPYGRSGQKFEGQKVVSARAIKHVQHLISHRGDAEAYLLFLVVRVLLMLIGMIPHDNHDFLCSIETDER
eukprot:m.29559 g.29559  ORF g.29559 m.29559 type:complete len:249 (+) comp11953_c0_seq5:508-1254(+)